MDFTGKTIAITDVDGPLPDAFATAFTQHGATVERIHDNANPKAFAAAHPAIDALIYMPRSLLSGPTLDVLQQAESLASLTDEVGRFLTLFQLIARSMTERQDGCILIVSALNGSTGWPGYALPSALNGALLALTRSLACELAMQNVRVLYLAHGSIAGVTPDNFAGRAPGGNAASPEDIAKVGVYLASERASFMTGTEVRADGGWKAWGLLK